MPARRKTTRTKEFTIFIPPKVDQLMDRVKVEIISGGTTTNVTNNIERFTVTRLSMDEGMDQCFLVLNNVDRKYLNADGTFLWSGGETVKVYQDYGTTSANLGDTHLLFKGRIHAPLASFSGGKHTFVIFCRKLPELVDRRRIVTFGVGTTFYDAAKVILGDYPDLIDTTTFDTNLSGDTGIIAATYDTSDFEILRDIFRKAGWTGHFDNDASNDGKFVLNGFLDDGGTKNNDVACVAGQTMLSLRGFGVHTEDVFTRVRVNGGDLGGSTILREKGDSTLETSLWRRDFVVRDSTVKSMDEADSRVGFELTELTAQKIDGSVVCLAQRGLFPGQQFRVHSVDDGVNGYFKAARVDFIFDDVFTMTVSINRRLRKSDLLRLVELNRKVDSNTGTVNPNDMKFSYNFTFDDNTNIAVSEGVEFVEGKIKNTGGEGSFTSDLLVVSESVSKMDFVLEAPENVEDSSIFVSANRGDDEFEIDIGNENVLIDVKAGTQLRVRMVLTGTSTAIGGLTVRAK